MNKEKNKKMISVVLTGAMMTSMVPSVAFAEVPTPETVTSKVVQKSAVTKTVASEAELETAISEATEQTVIQLTAEINATSYLTIAAGKDITLDLNGHTFNLANNRIQVEGNLVIQDSAQNGRISGSFRQMIMINKGGKVSLRSGSIQTTDYGAVRTNSGATFEMTGGTVIGAPAIQALNGNIIILGGSVLQEENAEYSAIVNDEGATITVGASGAQSSDDPYVEGLSIGENNDTFLNSGLITDVIGHFTANSVIKSTFGSDISDTLPAGMVCTGVNGRYTVSAMTEENAAAKVGDEFYATVPTAAAAMTEGQTLVLLRDVTADLVDSAIAITAPNCSVDLNGHNVTNTNEKGYGISLAVNYGSSKPDMTARIINSSDKTATIKAATPTNFGSGNSENALTISFEGSITFVNTSGQNISLSTGAKLLYSESAADAVANGGFRTTDADGDDYLYASLAEAIAASADGTVELVNDYSGAQLLVCGQGKRTTLDMQGHTYTYTGTSATENVIRMLEDNATLTIKDGKIDGGKTGGADILGSGNKLVLDNVDIIADEADYGIVTNGTQKDNNLVMKNGSSLSADKGVAIYWPSGGGSVSIDNSTITGHTGVQVLAGDLTVSGKNTQITATGKKQAKPEDEHDGSILDGAAISIIERVGYQDLGAVEIKNGAIVSERGDAISAYTYNDSTHEEGKWKDAGDVITVSGGHFSEPIDADFLDRSLKFEVISMNDTDAPYSYYKNEEAAEKAAGDGDIIIKVSDRDSQDKRYDIVLDYDYGNKTVEREVIKGAEVKLPNPSRSGYTFLGWLWDNKILSAGDTVTVNGNITLVAYREKKEADDTTYQVKIADASHGDVSVAAKDKWAEEGDRILITVKPDKGYEVKSVRVYETANRPVHVWEREDGKYAFVMPDHDVTIMANFVKSDQAIDEMPFVDVHRYNWFFEDVEYVYDKGLMTGTAYNKFEPNISMTRAMIVSVLHRLEGSPTPRNEAPFEDVADNAWYKEPVDWAESVGIIHGYSVDKFGPNDPITREQMAAILYNYSLYKGKDVSDRANLYAYSDYDEISRWARDVMRWAHAEGLINGVTYNTLDPQGHATRAQVAAIFHRYLEE